MVVGEISQPPIKDTTLTFQCPILTSTIWRMQDSVLQIGNLKTGKEMWETIKTRNLGADCVKEARLQTLITEFENLKMSDNDSIDAYATKLSGIASKSATLREVMSEHKLVKKFLTSLPRREVMSEHKLVKKFLTSLPRRFVHIVTGLEQVLDLKTTGFEDAVGRLKAYEKRVKEEDIANDAQENLLYARTEYSNRNNDTSGGRELTMFHIMFFDQPRPPKGGFYNRVQEDVAHTLEVVDEVEDKDVVGITRNTKVNVTPRNPVKRMNKNIRNMTYHIYSVTIVISTDTLFQNALNETEPMKLTLMRYKRKYTPPKSESNIDDDDNVWFGDGSCVSIKGKGSILFQGKNREHKLLKDVYYIPALRSNVISLGQATISGYDISIRGDFLTMRDSWGSLLIKVPHSANRLYKAQLKVGKEGTNEVRRDSDKEENLHSSSVTIHETSPESEEDHSRSDGTPIPIARLETIRLLIALVARKGWKIHHLDVKTAFLNGHRKKLNSTLEEIVYRDDIFVTGTSLDLINKFKKRMSSESEMSDLGELTYYLGIEVSQGKDCVEIKQERYARKILKEVGMENCNPALCRVEPGLKLSKAEDEPKVGVVSRSMQSPRVSHARAIKQILRYLKGTTSFGIKCNHSNDIKLVGYSDSSHNVDINDGRSTTRHVLYLDTSPITWCSPKQTTVALSSYKAEFMAATAATCQAICLRELLAEVTGLERQKVIIRVDNKSAISLSKNPVFHGRSKHIHTRYYFIRKCVENKQVIVEHVCEENQRADPLTKSLAHIRLMEMRSLLEIRYTEAQARTRHKENKNTSAILNSKFAGYDDCARLVAKTIRSFFIN
nr:uncharacterized mitochondrial protein AtMg00810-like [Tanacetum cinerariifolium]